MKPVVHGLEAKYAGQIDFIYLDIDDPANDAAKDQLGFRVQPQFFLLDADGTVVQEWLGPVDAEKFEAVFAQVLGP
jgi:thioredoxin-like negative regulator of GroEL